MCGAIDCPSCGPAQGYRVERRYIGGVFTFINPEGDMDDDGPEFDPEPPDAFDDFDASGRYESELDARAHQ